MNARFEQLEREHLERTDPLKLQFTLHAFPEENAALQRGWLEKLSDLLGPNRAEMLDQAIRRPISSSQFKKIRKRGFPFGIDRGKGVFTFSSHERDWLHRGTSEIKANVRLWFDRQKRQWIEIKFERDGMPGGSRTCPLEVLEERWRHLFPPQVLGLPTAL